MDEEQGIAINPIYILKVVGALVVLGAIAAASYLPGIRRWSGSESALLVVVLVAAALLLTALLWRVYITMDELGRVLHHGACVLALAIVALGSGVVGILQANDLMPVFSQFWLVGAVVAVWGVCLMLVDRRFK